jgi:uncharacterized protein (UPF0276 family)
VAIEIATPYSDLLAEPTLRASIFELSDVIEARDSGQLSGLPLPFLFHSDLNLVSRWGAFERELLKEIARHRGLRLISFHAASRYQHNRIRDGAFHGIGEPYTPREMEDRAHENVMTTREMFGPDLPILVENNNDLGTDAYRTVTDSEFLARLVRENGLHFLWDTAHSRITAVNRKIDHAGYMAKLPMECCFQVHLSGYRMERGVACDAHELLEEEDWAFFGEQLGNLPRLRFVTIEYYKDGTQLREQLGRLRSVVEGAV